VPVTAEIRDRPHTLGPYQLHQLLGRGGMGEVYRAYDTRRGRVVALKILQTELARDEGFRARFRRESDSAARLQNPHVVPIHDFGEIDGRLYIDMRLVDGVGLDRIVAGGPMNPRRAVALVGQVAEALADAHRNGILHRDIKPSNILVTPNDFVYLVDFGIARLLDSNVTGLTETGEALGTLSYMAPEQFGTGRPDARSDIYSLTCTLVECLTGRKPFNATTLPALMHAHLTAPPPRPSSMRADLPPALDDVIARGMAKESAARFATPQELVTAAQYALQWGQPTAPAPLPPPPTVLGQPSVVAPVPPKSRRGRTIALVAAALVLAVASGVTGFLIARTGSGGTPTAAPPDSAAIVAPQSPAAVASSAGAQAPQATGGKVDYVYSVESNYPVTLTYTNSDGDQVTSLSEDTPWTYRVDTTKWGPTSLPLLVASSTSVRPDTTVTCTIKDGTGKVKSTQSSSSAYASAICNVIR
jgi:serine/threonine protein kinase